MCIQLLILYSFIVKSSIALAGKPNVDCGYGPYA